MCSDLQSYINEFPRDVKLSIALLKMAQTTYQYCCEFDRFFYHLLSNGKRFYFYCSILPCITTIYLYLTCNYLE